ncbi:MAG: STAS domain-containing protein, partial [Planctomycetota bacterium]
EKEGELALARVQPAIRRILDMTSLDEVFPAFETVEEAISYLGGDPHGPSQVVKPGIRRTNFSGGE